MPVFFDGSALGDWQARHPTGIAVEVGDGDVAVLHRAGYSRLGWLRSVWGWPTPRNKACGAERAEVESWARIEGYEVTPCPCCDPACDPVSDGGTTCIARA
jgi:hypothetical protein